MKHAGRQTLEGLERLLEAIRQDSGLKEQRPGVFYRGGKAFLHFHEDPAGTFADVRSDRVWERFPVNSEKDRATLLQAVGRASGATSPSPTAG